MFTGIVEEVGEVVGIEFPDGPEKDAVLTVRGPLVTSDAGHGDSIAVDGVCLTVTSLGSAGPGTFTADLMPETLRRTALEKLAPGRGVNLERALRADARLGGHVVQGHVDGVARVVSLEPEGDGARLTLELPGGLARYAVEKGSVTIDGVSLTVAGLDGGRIAIALVPHTLAATTLGGLTPGDEVNVEADILAKHVERLLEARGGAG
jgi:riboflavin synthase